jgi:hypothetical protein
MADTQDTQAALRALHARVDELEQRRRRSVGELRFAILGTALTAALVVLTATTWVAGQDGAEPYTLWGLAQEGWQGFVMLTLVAGVALTTPALFLTDHPSRAGHLVMVWVTLLTAFWVIVVNTVVPDGADEAPGRWVTLLTALAIAAAHGFRAEELNDRQPALRRLGT